MAIGGLRRVELEEARDQLWAEAVAAFRAGAGWWPISEADNEQLAAQAALRTSTDPWMATIYERVAAQESWSTAEVLSSIIRMDVDRQTRSDSMRVGSCLRQLGYEKRKHHGSIRYHKKLGQPGVTLG